MNSRRFNWRLWSGLVLAIVAFVSYLFFVQFPITRDVPWVNYILFVIATVLLISGVRRAERKVVPSIVAALGIGMFAFFIFGVTVLTKMLPPSVTPIGAWLILAKLTSTCPVDDSVPSVTT